MLSCVDNSGATLVECIANLGTKRHSKIGENLDSSDSTVGD